MGEREELLERLESSQKACFDAGQHIAAMDIQAARGFIAQEASRFRGHAQSAPQPSDSNIGAVLGLFHRNACYPDATPVEVSLATLQIRSLFALRAPEAADAGAVAAMHAALVAISNKHLGDQPAHSEVSEYVWAQQHIAELRRIARHALVDFAQSGATLPSTDGGTAT